MKIEKIKPRAEAEWDYGNDGRDGRYYVKYSCPKCGKIIRSMDIACDKCGTFFNWDSTARIKMKPTIVWE